MRLDPGIIDLDVDLAVTEIEAFDGAQNAALSILVRARIFGSGGIFLPRFAASSNLTVLSPLSWTPSSPAFVARLKGGRSISSRSASAEPWASTANFAGVTSGARSRARIDPDFTTSFFPEGSVTTPSLPSTSKVLPRNRALSFRPVTGGSGLK